jgi:hypothetical protein
MEQTDSRSAVGVSAPEGCCTTAEETIQRILAEKWVERVRQFQSQARTVAPLSGNLDDVASPGSDVARQHGSAPGMDARAAAGLPSGPKGPEEPAGSSDLSITGPKDDGDMVVNSTGAAAAAAAATTITASDGNCSDCSADDNSEDDSSSEESDGDSEPFLVYTMYAKSMCRDIAEHVDVMYEYALGCVHVTACGLIEEVTPWVFARALHDGHTARKAASDAGPPPRLVCTDVWWRSYICTVREVCTAHGISFRFMKGNDLDLALEPTDLLFIDTWHVYGHLKRELEQLSPLVRRYIMVHDTTVDEVVGESVRCRMNIKEQARESGYPEEEIRRGVGPAIAEFIDRHGDEWALEARFTHCNGLTIFKRVGGAPAPALSGSASGLAADMSAGCDAAAAK